MKKLAYYISLLMIFASSWENIALVEGIGRISKVIGILLACVWLVGVLLTGEIRRPRIFHISVALFVTWSAASLLWTVDVEATLAMAKTFVQLLIMVFILWDLLRTTVDVERAMQAYVLGGFVSIGSVAVNYWQSVEVMHQRFAASGFNPNDFSLIVALGMPMAWYLAVLSDRANSSRILRMLNFIFLPAALMGILLAASRGSLIAVSPFAILLAVSLTRLSFWPRVLIGIGVGCLIVALPFIAPADSVNRLLTAGESISSGDMNGRVAIWKEGLQALTPHQLLGVGSGAFSSATPPNTKSAHNVFISILVEVGPIGLALFIWLLVLVGLATTRLPRWQAWLWSVVLLIWLLGALVHTWEQRKQTWLVFSFVTVSAAAVRKEGIEQNHDESQN